MLDYYYDIKTREEVFVYSRDKQIRRYNDIAFYCYVPYKYKYKFNRNCNADMTYDFFDYGSKQKEKFIKLEFNVNEKDTYYEIQNDNETRNMHTKYLRVIEDEDYYAEDESSKDYTAVVFDIEVGTLSATFPNAKNGFLLAIGCKKANSDEDIHICEIGVENISENTEPPLKKELDVFMEFAEFLAEVNPDLLVGYNSIAFDYNFLVERLMVINELTEHAYAKKVYYVLDKLLSYPNGYNYLRTCREKKTGLHYDIFTTDVMRDVTIRELRSMTLKDVSRYYGAEDVKEFEKHEMKHINLLYKSRHDDFIEYLKSDIRSTELLYNKYFTVNIRLASILGVPVSFITSQTNATVPALYVAKLLYSKGFMPIGTNISRYKEIDIESIKYEGALVELWKHGYIKKLYKVDFSRMYPSAMLQFNLSPENIELYGMYDLDYCGKNGDKNPEEIVWAIPAEDGIIYAIRDNNLGKRIAIMVKKERGILCDGIETILSERVQAKKRKKIAEKQGNIKDLNNAIADEQSYKKIANALYGIFGNKYTPVGDFLLALTVTGMCRYISSLLRKEFISDGCFVELDTDGFLIDKNLDIDKINLNVKEICSNLYSNKTEKVDDKEMAIMHLEKEEFGGGFMYKEKNYILEIINDKNEIIDYIIHGSAFKSSTKPKAYIDAVKEFYEIYKENIVDEKRVDKLYDVYGMDKRKLVMTFKVSKSREEYKYTNDKIISISEANKIYNSSKNSFKRIKAFEKMLDDLKTLIEELLNIYTTSHNEEDIDNEARAYYDSYNVNFLNNQKLKLDSIVYNYQHRIDSIYELYPDYIYIYETIIDRLNLQQQSINLALTLMNEYEGFYHTKVNKGDYIEYYYTKDKTKYHIAEIVEAENFSSLDYDKYREFIADLHGIFIKYHSMQHALNIF